MTARAIRAVLRKAPFRPCKLVLADGREVLVPHQELISFSPAGTLWVFSGAETFLVLETALVTAVIPEATQSSESK